MEAILAAAADAAMDGIAPDLVLLYVRKRVTLRLVEVRPRRRAAVVDDGPPHRVGECLCGLAAQSGIFTGSADIRHDPRCVRTECKRAGYASFAAMPIHGSGGVVAVLGLASFRRRDFGRKRVFIEAIGAQIGVAIENASLRRQAESRMEELRQAGRASTLGELAAQLAHELNQPLAAILTNAQSLKRMLDKRPVPMAPARDTVGAIVRDDRRAAEVIRHLRGLLQGDAASAGRGGRLRMESIVRDVLSFLGGMLRTAKVEAVVRGGRRVPAVIGNRIEMTQVLVNLVRNAIESMEGVPAGGRRLTIEIGAAEGGRAVAVSVTDTGAGFAEQVLDQPFKPFQSTKAGGLGLGLSICRRILDAHGGRMEIGRGKARGATVSVILPAARKDAA